MSIDIASDNPLLAELVLVYPCIAEFVKQINELEVLNTQESSTEIFPSKHTCDRLTFSKKCRNCRQERSKELLEGLNDALAEVKEHDELMEPLKPVRSDTQESSIGPQMCPIETIASQPMRLFGRIREKLFDENPVNREDMSRGSVLYIAVQVLYSRSDGKFDDTTLVCIHHLKKAMQHFMKHTKTKYTDVHTSLPVELKIKECDGKVMLIIGCHEFKHQFNNVKIIFFEDECMMEFFRKNSRVRRCTRILFK